MGTLNRRHFLAAVGGGLLAAQSKPQPNIVFILADDLGYGDVGCYGQKKIQTPNIDRLAAEGMRFTQAYAGAPSCAPSRCCLMTGVDTGHARIRGNSGRHGERVPLEPDDVTIAEVLKTAGYRTGIFGKWGLGEAGTFGVPNDQGFDEWFGFLNQDHALEYYPTHLWNNRTEFFPPGNQGAKHNQYAQDLITDRTLKFLDSSAQAPFFLYVPYTLPHASSELGRDTGDGYVVPNYKPYERESWPDSEKGYAAMVTRLDSDIGKIVSRVRQLGLEHNTLIIFASDNGPAATERGHDVKFFGSAGPLRGEKWSLYEAGIRIPFIARWPGKIEAGKTNEQPIAFWDMLSTFAEMAGVPAPSGIDGIPVTASLLGGNQKPHEYLYWETVDKGGAQAVRMGPWKAVRHPSGVELYDLEKDLSESHDIASEHPDIVKHMREIFHQAHTDSPNFALPLASSL
jgi:arylsulfatase A-like enzyme